MLLWKTNCQTWQFISVGTVYLLEIVWVESDDRNIYTFFFLYFSGDNSVNLVFFVLLYCLCHQV